MGTSYLGSFLAIRAPEDWSFGRASGWKLTFRFLPRYCYLSGKRLWLEKSYEGVNIITGPGTLIYEYFYIGKNEFLIWKLKI